jgi:D-alanine-D-alanine ligase-like ATP-grasp enzyme
VKVTVLHDPWRPHPLAWIHRAEARSILRELREAGHEAGFEPCDERDRGGPPPGVLLLRLSDPVMLAATQRLAQAGVDYVGPGAATMARCYDKLEATRIAAARGVDIPATALASGPGAIPFPLVLKPRRGSDSIGVRVLRRGPLPAGRRNGDHIVQEHVRGAELTVGVIHGRVGHPIRIRLPEGTPYSFARKYLFRPGREPLADAGLAARVHAEASRVAEALGVNWAARLDFLHETATGRLKFLECDVAPLVGGGSAFAASLAASGIARAEQLRLLLAESAS